MLETIKKMMGINNEDFDSIINAYIESAVLDLESVGIVVNQDNALIQTAIITYVKSHLDLDDAELFASSYFLQKDALKHMREYTEENTEESE